MVRWLKEIGFFSIWESWDSTMDRTQSRSPRFDKKLIWTACSTRTFTNWSTCWTYYIDFNIRSRITLLDRAASKKLNQRKKDWYRLSTLMRASMNTNLFAQSPHKKRSKTRSSIVQRQRHKSRFKAKDKARETDPRGVYTAFFEIF